MEQSSSLAPAPKRQRNEEPALPDSGRYFLVRRGHVVCAAEKRGEFNRWRFKDGQEESLNNCEVICQASPVFFLEAQAVGAWHDVRAWKRFWKELDEVVTSHPQSVIAGPVADDAFYWQACIVGPEGTAYESRRFYLGIRFSSAYPFRPPELRFITPVYHTNVKMNTGAIDASFLKDKWMPGCTVIKLLRSVQNLLSHATPDVFPRDFHHEARDDFKTDVQRYQAKARNLAQKHGEFDPPRPSLTAVQSVSEQMSEVLVEFGCISGTSRFRVDATTTVGQLREAVSNRGGLSPKYVHLILKSGRPLISDSATLVDLGVQNGCVLDFCNADHGFGRATVLNAYEHAVKIKFDGHIRNRRGIVCVASFPGKYGDGWDKAVQLAKLEDGSMSLACVFLPELTKRFGVHSSTTSGKCLCHDMYGEHKRWGCEWARAWMENIEKAVQLGQKLHVYYFAGEVGRGKVDSWERCGEQNLRSEQLLNRMQTVLDSLDAHERQRLQRLPAGERNVKERQLFLDRLEAADRQHLESQWCGLGWSQKAEVAWLDKRYRETGNSGYKYVELDVMRFINGS